MKLFLTTCLLVLFILATTVSAQPHYNRWEISVGGSFSPTFTVLHTPLSLRSIPLHPDDGRLRDLPNATNPLPDTSLLAWTSLNWEIRLAYGLSEHFNTGVIVNLGKKTGWRYQQNQYGSDHRGWGKSLRWYEVENQVVKVCPMVSFKPSPIELSDELEIYVEFGGSYDLFGSRLKIITGYDRFDQDQEWKKETVLLYRQHSLWATGGLIFPKIGSSNTDILLWVGYSHYMYEISQAKVSYERGRANPLTFGLGVGF